MNTPILFLKSHIETFTRKDGVVVQAHDDKRVAAQPQFPVGHKVRANLPHMPHHPLHGQDVTIKEHAPGGRYVVEKGGAHHLLHASSVQPLPAASPSGPAVGQKVTVHKPGHFYHGKTGTVMDGAGTEGRSLVKIDGGGKISLAHADLRTNGAAPPGAAPAAPSAAAKPAAPAPAKPAATPQEPPRRVAKPGELESDAKKLDANTFLDRYVAEMLPAHMAHGLQPANVIHDRVSPGSLDSSEYEDWDEMRDFLKEQAGKGNARPQDHVARMAAQFRAGGAAGHNPVLVNGHKDDAKYAPQVIDGHHRTLAHLNAGAKSINIIYDIKTLAGLWKQQNPTASAGSAQQIADAYEKHLAARAGAPLKKSLSFGEAMNKPVVFLKSHVDAFTRKDGVVVQAHDTKVQARSAPDTRTKNEGNGFHGAAMNSHRYEKHGPDGDARSEAEHRDQYKAADHAFSHAAHALVGAGHFANHDQARDFLDSTHGRHLGDEVGHKGDVTKPKWLGRSVKTFKKDNGIVDNPGAAPRAASASPAPAAAPAGVHHSELREGDEIEGPDGERHEYSHTEQGLGRKVVHTAAGFKHPTERDGTLKGFKKTGTNFANQAPAAKPAARQRRGSAPIQQKGAPPVEGVAQPSAAEKVAAGRKKIADRAVVQKTGEDIGAGSWSKGHKVKIHAPGHALHGKEGVITGPDTKAPGRVVLRHDDGTGHSVHGSDLRPALGHSWPQ